MLAGLAVVVAVGLLVLLAHPARQHRDGHKAHVAATAAATSPGCQPWCRQRLVGRRRLRRQRRWGWRRRGAAAEAMAERGQVIAIADCRLQIADYQIDD
jgi:hypothetical protein